MKTKKLAIISTILSIMLFISACSGSPADIMLGGGGDNSSSGGGQNGGTDSSSGGGVVEYSRGTFEGSYYHVESGHEINLASNDTLYFVQDGTMFYGTYVYDAGYFEFTYDDGSVDTGYFMTSDPEHPYKPVLFINGIGKFISADVYYGDDVPTSNLFVGEFYYEDTNAHVAFYADGTFGFFDEFNIIDPDFFEGDYEHNGSKITLRSDFHGFVYTFEIVDNDTLWINGLDGYFYRAGNSGGGIGGGNNGGGIGGGNNGGGEMPDPPAYYAAFEEYNLFYSQPNTGRHYFMNGVYYDYDGGFNHMTDDCDVEVVLHEVEDHGDGTQTTHFTAYIYFINRPPDTAMDSHSYTTLFDYYTGYTFKFGDADTVSYTLPYNGRDIVIELTKSFTYDYYIEDSYLVFTLDYTMVSPVGYDGLVYSFDRAAYDARDAEMRVDESFALAYGTPFYEYDHFYMHENFYFKILGY